ncbi:Metallo-dependent phosphatase-like protein [Cantharellus anzutake]|uniref:Metallo-dependent phosphatase-like protein n=1 Tax=Cantharellus anzutake TaxID=1750568 RepID=UPI00190507E3|nr:Metallo-dependent phosphatase-like protein [Cantharellus anzutake]KAF8341222.1 Metallo-dependent phosphatase-like protein [Cantharellus anzutake]
MSSDAENENASGSLSNLAAEDTIKIMLATDNHIGYLERDPVRGQDAINTFEEILKLAAEYEVDLILLGGDLFHENKPSRESLYRTCALLRKYTMGDRPVQIEVLSDPFEGKGPGFDFPAINYEDPNYNVSTPIFSIHGNHDDPQGSVSGTDGALCALDVLSITGLLNYFGKSDLPSDDYAPNTRAHGHDAGASSSSEGLQIKPVLLRKGRTHLGLYGVGNVKDSRMHYELMNNRVKMWKPKTGNWCNFLIVHQNRVKHSMGNYVPETLFDDSINLVIWGHEHDCRMSPVPVSGKSYHITQPGSSVATSLTEGEAIHKHVAIIRVHGTDYDLTPIPLRTVRPFICEDLDLGDELEDKGLDVNDQMEIMKIIRSRVEELIVKVKDQWVSECKDISPMIRSNKLPENATTDTLEGNLIGIVNVDTTDIPNMGNPNRFGQEFHGRVANKDPIVYHQTKKRAQRKIKADQPKLSIDEDPEIATLSLSEKLSRIRVGTLVHEYLSAQELQLLGENGMSDAVQMFVDKDDSHSIQTYVSKALDKMISSVDAGDALDENEVANTLTRLKEQHEAEYEAEQEARRVNRGKGKSKASAPAPDRDSMDEDDDFGDAMSMDEVEDAPPKSRAKASSATAKKSAASSTRKAPAKKAAAQPRGKAKKKLFDDSDEVEEDQLDEIEEEH